MAAYLELLVSYPSEALEAGYQVTMREWDKASMMPTPNFIIERVEEYLVKREHGSSARWVLDRGDKPPDWEPLSRNEIDAMKRKARERAEQLWAEIGRAAETVAMPDSSFNETEWNRRRDLQLKAFRSKNPQAGEV